MPDTPDKGTEQAGEKGGATATASQATGAGATPDVETLKQQLESERARAEEAHKAVKVWEGRYGNLNKKYTEREREVVQYRRLVAQSGDGGTVVDDGGSDPAATSGSVSSADRALARSSWAMLAQELPGSPEEKRALRERVEKFIEEDPEASAFVRSDPYHTYRAVVEHWGHESDEKELKELREWKKKAAEGKDFMAASAGIAGASSSSQPIEISEKELAGMTKEQMEKKFGKDRLLAGLRPR